MTNHATTNGDPELDRDEQLRQHVATLIDGKGAHLTFEAVLDGWPADARHVAPEGTPHTAWQLLEHMRLAQRDILEFCINPRYAEPRFPDDYWPLVAVAPDAAAWTESLAQFAHDRGAMKQLVADRSTDLFRPIPHGTGQTILREALVVADHNAYHLGQLVLLRRLLGQWHSPAVAL